MKISKLACKNENGLDDKLADQFHKIFVCDVLVCAIAFNGIITAGYGDDVKSYGLYARSYPNYRVFSFIDGKLSNIKEHDRTWCEKVNEPYKLPDFLKKEIEIE